MRLFSTFYLFFACLSLGFSQVPKGATEDLLELNSNDLILSMEENGFYYTRRDKSKASYLEYKDFGQPKSKSLKLNLTFDQKGNKALEETFPVKDKIYVFSSIRLNDLRRNDVYVQEIDKATLEPLTEPEKILELAYFKWHQASNRIGIKFQLSKDSTKLLLSFRGSESIEDKRDLQYIVYDLSSKNKWEKLLFLPKLLKEEEKEDSQIQKVEIDNNGNLHFLKLERFGLLARNLLLNHQHEYYHSRKRKLKAGYEYSLDSYFANGSPAKETKINFPDHFITDLGMDIHPSGDLVFTGLYAPKESFQIAGFFYYTLDPVSHSIKLKQLNEMPKESFQLAINKQQGEKLQKLEAKDGNKSKTKLFEFMVKNIVFNDKGGAYVVVEKEYIDEVPVKDGDVNNFSTRIIHHFENIIVFSVSDSGQLKWTEKIVKKQITDGFEIYYSSYFLLKKEEGLCFFLNVSKSEIEDNEIFDLTKVAKPIWVKLTETGDQSIGDFPEGKKGFLFQPIMVDVEIDLPSMLTSALSVLGSYGSAPPATTISTRFTTIFSVSANSSLVYLYKKKGKLTNGKKEGYYLFKF